MALLPNFIWLHREPGIGLSLPERAKNIGIVIGCHVHLRYESGQQVSNAICGADQRALVRDERVDSDFARCDYVNYCALLIAKQ
jgi:hypothetical protein